METKKTFDCIAFKRQAQESVYEQTKGLNPEQEAAWYRNQAVNGPFREFLKRTESSKEILKPEKAA